MCSNELSVHDLASANALLIFIHLTMGLWCSHVNQWIYFCLYCECPCNFHCSQFLFWSFLVVRTCILLQLILFMILFILIHTLYLPFIKQSKAPTLHTCIVKSLTPIAEDNQEQHHHSFENVTSKWINSIETRTNVIYIIIIILLIL